MYLPNAQYIPAPFKQSLKANATEPMVKPTVTLSANPKVAQASPPEIPDVSKNSSAKPDIVAAESSAKHQTHNDGMETALLLLLLMDGIH